MSDKWFVYIIESQNGRLYTGITKDLQKRFKDHQTGKGAKFFRSSPPKSIVYTEESSSRSEASKREAEIKKMTRFKKIKLIKSCA